MKKAPDYKITWFSAKAGGHVNFIAMLGRNVIILHGFVCIDSDSSSEWYSYTKAMSTVIILPFFAYDFFVSASWIVQVHLHVNFFQ